MRLNRDNFAISYGHLNYSMIYKLLLLNSEKRGFCFFVFLSFSVSSYTQQFSLKADFKKEEAKKTGRSWTSTRCEFCLGPTYATEYLLHTFFFCLLYPN
jgi:hypothetical protein